MVGWPNEIFAKASAYQRLAVFARRRRALARMSAANWRRYRRRSNQQEALPEATYAVSGGIHDEINEPMPSPSSGESARTARPGAAVQICERPI